MCPLSFPWVLSLVKEGLKDDDLIAGLNKGHEGTEHPYGGG
jgi:hypothetical protein